MQDSYYNWRNHKGEEYNSKVYNQKNFKIPKNSQEEFFTLGDSNNPGAQQQVQSMNLFSSRKSLKNSLRDSDHFSRQIKQSRRDYGNEDPKITGLFEITVDQKIRKMGTNFTNVHAVSEKVCFLSNKTNIYEFYRHNPYNVVKPQFLLQGNFTDILALDHIYDKPVFLAKSGENVKFCKLGKSKKLEVFSKIQYNPFDHVTYQNAIVPSKDKKYLFVREKENKILMLRFSERTHQNELYITGLTVYEQGLRILSFFYDYKNCLLFVFFTNCKYAVEMVKGSSQRGKQNMQKQVKDSRYLGSPSKKKPRITTEMRPGFLSGFDSDAYELKSAVMCQDRRHFFVSVYDKGKGKNWIGCYKRSGPSLKLSCKTYVRDLEGKIL